MHTTRKQRGALSHTTTVLLCITPTRSAARARAVVSRIRFSCRGGLADRDEIAILVEQTREYLRHPEYERGASGAPAHNKGTRITNASVRYRVFGRNYIGRKNDTELRAIRWQREITPAMRSFLFCSLARERLSCETAYTELRSVNGALHGIASLSLAGFSSVLPSSS